MITAIQILNLFEDKKKNRWETITYKSWDSMKQRCNNKNHVRYKEYGGRGIKVCKRWNDSYDNFYADMGARPVGKTLDRKNPNQNYTPKNCIWSTVKEQNNNLRSNNIITYKGKTKTVTNWAKEKDINPSTLFSRLNNGWNNKDALSKSGKN